VGNDKSIPNTNGFRNDVVAALRELSAGDPLARWLLCR
jgi:alpha-N-arabinofuranosidase